MGILLAPVIIGIPLLLIKRTETWIAAIEEDHRRVEIHVTGRVVAPVMEELHAVLGLPSTPAKAMSAAAVEQVLAPGATPRFDVTELTVRQVGDVTESSFPGQVLKQTTRSSSDNRWGDTAPMTKSGGKPTIASSRSSVWADSAIPTTVSATPSASVSDSEPTADSGMTMVRPKEIEPPKNESASSGTTEERTHSSQTLVAHFDTGEQIELDDGQVAFVGRDPGRIGEASEFSLISILDPDMSISKTHLRLIRCGDVIEVADLGSTNGTTASTSEGAAPVPLTPEKPIALGVGATVTFGKRKLLISATTESP